MKRALFIEKDQQILRKMTQCNSIIEWVTYDTTKGARKNKSPFKASIFVIFLIFLCLSHAQFYIIWPFNEKTSQFSLVLEPGSLIQPSFAFREKHYFSFFQNIFYCGGQRPISQILKSTYVLYSFGLQCTCFTSTALVLTIANGVSSFLMEYSYLIDNSSYMNQMMFQKMSLQFSFFS